MENKNFTLLKNVLKCIKENLCDDQFKVETICEYVGLSERQLQRKIKAITKKSPNQLIRTVRLRQAKKMLLSQPDKILDIAFQTGFTNPSYFSRCFKIEFGVSPSDFLQQKKYMSEMY